MRKKIIVILGPTSSGKTGLSIKLAKDFEGEIVSADSRQVYIGMDLGSGKVTKKEMQGIPHHLLSIASPKKRFDVVRYKKLADEAIKKILIKNKVPFLVGGTGFYIQAVVDNILMPSVKPDWNFRKKLGAKPISELYEMLLKLDPRRAGNVDRNNPRRLIRALEIVLKSKRPVPATRVRSPEFEALFLGVKKERKELKKLIEKRLSKRLKSGMVKEVEKLHASEVSWKRLEEFGLEYRYVAQYLQKKINRDEMLNLIQKESEKFAKRQMTWFKRNKKIKWVKNFGDAKKLTKHFLQ